MNATCSEWNAFPQFKHSIQITSTLRANLFSGREVLTYSTQPNV
jgi:hypothetical protein